MKPVASALVVAVGKNWTQQSITAGMQYNTHGRGRAAGSARTRRAVAGVGEDGAAGGAAGNAKGFVNARGEG